MHASGVQLRNAAAKRAKHEGDDSTTYVNRKALERRKKREAERRKKAAKQ
jgi:hypothetical protein